MIPDYYAWFFSQRSTLMLYEQKEQAISLVKKHGMYMYIMVENDIFVIPRGSNLPADLLSSVR